jgi:lipopolysaccharide transport system ATP-binding protein
VAASEPRQARRVGIAGTFDVENFGDLLFPILAERELSSRLGAIEITRYSYWEKVSGAWPFSVHSLDRLIAEMPDLDLLIVGGGHLVRFDKDVAPGYSPPPAGHLHHPTGYWLMPTLLAASYGVPIAWNALGVSPDTPIWARGLLDLALRSTNYVAVRDDNSRRELAAVAKGVEVAIVPDTAFGARGLLPRHPSDAFLGFCEESGLHPPFIVIQPSAHLGLPARQVDDVLRAAESAGLAILELPVSPALGDRVGLLGLRHSVHPPWWPQPLLLAEIVSRAEAVIAVSLHLSIVALTCGVPVHRRRPAPSSKYEQLAGLPGVHLWHEGDDAAALLSRGLGRSEPDALITDRLRQLDSHWNTIAALCGRVQPGASHVTAELIERCTADLEAASRGSESAAHRRGRQLLGLR